MKKTDIVLLVFLFFSFTFGFSQISKTVVLQDAKLEQIFKEKQQIDSKNNNNEAYKIQVYYGSELDSKNKLKEFKKNFNATEAIIVYANPNFKVLVGNYRYRLYAEKALLEIKEKYPQAFLIQPSK